MMIMISTIMQKITVSMSPTTKIMTMVVIAMTIMAMAIRATDQARFASA